LLKVVLPTVVALGVGAAVAGALPSGSSGVINACVNTNANVAPWGSVRIIDTTATNTVSTSEFPLQPVNACDTDETSVTWNQTGPAGPTGAQGAQGSQGGQGPQGIQGIQGPAGADASGGGSSDSGLPAGYAAYLQFVTGSGRAPVVQGESQVKIPGEDPSAQAVDPIQISDFSFQVQNPNNLGSTTGGAGAGKITFQPLIVSRTLDKNSPLLFKASAMGAHYGQVLLSIVHTAGGGGKSSSRLVAQWRLGIVFVRSIAYSSGDEQDTFDFGSVLFNYYPQNANGSSATAVVGGWNRLTNQSVDNPSDLNGGVSRAHNTTRH
jgi:type VI protein secretion system component Hcp